jgi:hypothetical protein
MSTSADLGIEYIAGQQAQPEITHNSALNQLQILQTGVISVALNTPPGSPAQGDSYIIGASPTGAWSGRANCLAGYFGTGWVFVPGNSSAGTPIAMGVRHEGLSVWSKADNAFYIWNGSAWAASGSGMSNPMTTTGDVIVGGASGVPGRVGIGTTGQVFTVVGGTGAWAAPSNPWVSVASWTYSSDVANVDFINLGAYTELMVIGDAITASISGTRNLLVSVNNGSTFYNTSGDYVDVANTGGTSNLAAIPAHSSAAATARSFIVGIMANNLTSTSKLITRSGGLTALFKASTSPINAIRIVNASGNLTGGSIQVYGR